MSANETHRRRGKVWVFGDDVDTDQMAPFATLTSGWDEIKKAMFPERRDFVDSVQPGDIIVAGRNWGCGSSREHAPENLKKLGVSAVLAESFARIYFRNCIAIAFPNAACPGITQAVDARDEVELDLETGIVKNLTRSRQLRANPYTKEMLDIVAEGGLMNRLAAQIAASNR